VPEAGPRPVFGTIDQASYDRIAMHVTELLNALGFGVDVEVIVTALPKRALASLDRDRKLERLKGCRKHHVARLTQEKMNVFGHDHVSGDEQPVSNAHGFERSLEQIARRGRTEIRLPVIARERNEVEVAGPLIPDEALWHEEIVSQIAIMALGISRKDLVSPHLRSEMWGTHVRNFPERTL
jgi:hypothetical protein